MTSGLRRCEAARRSGADRHANCVTQRSYAGLTPAPMHRPRLDPFARRRPPLAPSHVPSDLGGGNRRHDPRIGYGSGLGGVNVAAVGPATEDFSDDGSRRDTMHHRKWLINQRR